MVIPPDIDATRITGGAWDGLQRTLAWTVDTLEPGETLDQQAWLGGVVRSTKFPVLVKCYSPHLYSRINLTTEYAEQERVQLNLEESSSVLYRKTSI